MQAVDEPVDQVETSSRFPMRASTAGSMKRAPGMTWVSTAISHPRARQRHGLEQAIDDRVGRHTFRLRVEVRDDAVTGRDASERMSSKLT